MVNVRLRGDLDAHHSTWTCIPLARTSKAKRCVLIFYRFLQISFSQKTHCVRCRSESVVFGLGCDGERAERHIARMHGGPQIR